MARVTVEDCAEVVHSRFELVALAAQRAKTIAAGGEITISRDNDKNPVVALREIADRTIQVDDLREALIRGNQEKVNVDEYGVEEMGDERPTDLDEAALASEAAEELSGFHSGNRIPADEDEEEDLYGGDDVDLED